MRRLSIFFLKNLTRDPGRLPLLPGLAPGSRSPDAAALGKHLLYEIKPPGQALIAPGWVSV